MHADRCPSNLSFTWFTLDMTVAYGLKGGKQSAKSLSTVDVGMEISHIETDKVSTPFLPFKFNHDYSF